MYKYDKFFKCYLQILLVWTYQYIIPVNIYTHVDFFPSQTRNKYLWVTLSSTQLLSTNFRKISYYKMFPTKVLWYERNIIC